MRTTVTETAMHRQTLLATLTALSFAPQVALSQAATEATPRDVLIALGTGKTVLLDS